MDSVTLEILHYEGEIGPDAAERIVSDEISHILSFASSIYERREESYPLESVLDEVGKLLRTCGQVLKSGTPATARRKITPHGNLHLAELLAASGDGSWIAPLQKTHDSLQRSLVERLHEGIFVPEHAEEESA